MHNCCIYAVARRVAKAATRRALMGALHGIQSRCGRLRRPARACTRGEWNAPTTAGCRRRSQAAGLCTSSAPRPLRQAVELLSQVHGCHDAPRCALYRKGTAVLRQACGRRRRGGTERLWKDDEQNACQPAKGRSKPPPAYVIKALSEPRQSSLETCLLIRINREQECHPRRRTARDAFAAHRASRCTSCACCARAHVQARSFALSSRAFDAGAASHAGTFTHTAAHAARSCCSSSPSASRTSPASTISLSRGEKHCSAFSNSARSSAACGAAMRSPT